MLLWRARNMIGKAATAGSPCDASSILKMIENAVGEAQEGRDEMAVYHRLGIEDINDIPSDEEWEVDVEYDDMTPAQQYVVDAARSFTGKELPMGLTKDEMLRWMHQHLDHG
jgi:hypothetical protein